MKRISADERAVTFQLSIRERDTLIEILQAYPVVPPAHFQLSKELKDPHLVEYQRLLDEALGEQRAANRRHLQEWLAAAERFQKASSGCRFRLERSDSEWLLQVLNDIRVGHWLLLGSPDPSRLQLNNFRPRLLP